MLWGSRGWVRALCGKLRSLEWEGLRERGFAFGGHEGYVLG